MTFSKLTSAAIIVVIGLIATAVYFARDNKAEPAAPVVDEIAAPEAAPLSLATPVPNAAPVPILPSAAEVPPLSPQDREQLRVADDVLAKASDNDPRMDKELKTLSAPVREQLRVRYGQIKSESRNSKGTVVFLLGRNLREPADLDFLASVLAETPCLSLADCTRAASSTGLSEDDHHNGGVSVALAYPQLVALHSLSRLLEQDPALANQPAMKKKVVEVIQKGLASPVSEVAASAREVQRRLR